MWWLRKRSRRSAKATPVEVKSVLADAEHAYEVGLVAGVTGEPIEQAMATVHWRDVLRATREADADAQEPSSAERDPRRAGQLPPGAHRPDQ